MRIRDSIPALGLLAFAMAPAGLAQSQRCDDYLERNPNADAQLVHFIDQVFPGEALLKVSVPDFVMLWHAAPFYREGAPHQRGVRLFRSFQNAALGLRTLPRAWEKFTRPTTANGPFAYTPPVNTGDAVILEQEPNDTIAQANPFTCGDTVEGEVSPALEDDIFELVLTGATALQARVDPGTSGSPIGDARLEILDPAGNSIAFNDDFNGLMPQINILLLPGTYYFLVDGFSSNTGTYVFSPNCTAVTTLDCSNSSSSGTIVAPDQSDVYLLNLASPDTVVLEVLPRSAGFRSELSVTSGGTLLALTDRGGFLPGSARISLGLAAGSVLLSVGGKDGESLGSYDITVNCTGAGLPGLACGATGTFPVSQESSPLIDLGVPGAQNIQLDINDLALYDSTEAAVEDSTGTVYFDSGTAAKPAPGTYSLSSLASNGSRLRLIADPVSFIPSALRTWNGNTTYPRNWDNPGTTYAGPTDVTLSAGGFPFSDEHVNSAGMMVLRKYEYFDCQGGGWDVGTYIDESYIEIDLGAGPQRVYPSHAVMQTGDGVDWAVKRVIGTMADVSADDGSYLAFNLADTRRASDDWFTIDLYFDVRSLGFTGSQIQSLRFYAEWYFGGNPSGSTTTPPSGGDESEEYNIYLDRVELARRGGHWDFVADILDPFQYTPPPLPLKSPAVDVTLTCTPFASTTTMSLEDVAPGNITAAAPFTAFTQAVGDIGRSVDVTATAAQVNVGGDTWRDHPYANTWSRADLNHPGPIMQSIAFPPAGILSGTGDIKLRVYKDTCWDSTVWDDAHYYDIVKLTVTQGGVPTDYFPTSWTQEGDAPNFTYSLNGIYYANSIADLAADDGVYGRGRLEDYNSTVNGPQAQYWDEFTFTGIPAGGVDSIAVEIELYMRGSGSSTTVSSISNDSSEEIGLIDLDVQLWDTGAGTWFDIDPTPIIDASQYSSPAACGLLGLDPQVWAFAADGTFLGTDDDSGGGFDSEITVAIDPNTAVTFVVGASAVASVGRTEGLLDFGIEGPFGYAGDGPFTVGLGSTFTWRVRGNPGDYPIGLITMFPNMPLGIGFAPPFEGKLIADVSALINLDPNGGSPLPSSGLYESATIPVPSDPLLVGARIDGQLLVLDAALTTFTFFNGDHIVLQ